MAEELDVGGARMSRYPGAEPAVVYIAGSGRSGSTLLERVLGAIPGYVNVGELIDLPRRVVPNDERCGCGEPFSRCPFWSEVGSRLGDGWSPIWLAEVHRLQTVVARQRYLPRLLVPGTKTTFARNVGEYARRYRSMYAAIAATAHASYVVDASKWPSQALALSRGGTDIRVIHLIRDVRGVANSLRQTDVDRPHVAGESAPMYSNSLSEGAARWAATQTEADLLARTGIPVTRVRYDDFVADPRAVIRRALHEIGAGVPESGLDHLSVDDAGTPVVTLGPSHGISGNPSRFRHGVTRLRPDDAWRQTLRPGQQRLTQVIAFPQVVRDELDRRRATPTAPEVTAPPLGPDSGWPLVSVIMPTRGRPDLCAEAVTAVVDQDYPGQIECLVVHDQETVNPALAAMSRPDRSVRAVTNEGTPGLAGARNYGLTLTTGPVVATCDDDDRWHHQKVRRQVERLRADPDLLLVGSGVRLLLPKGRVDAWVGRSETVTYEQLLSNRVKELHSSTLMMPRSTFAVVGTYDETLPNGYAEDYDFVLRVAKAGPLGIVREPLADIRKDNVSYYRGRQENAAVALEYFLAKHPEIAESRAGHARMLGQIAFARSCTGDRRTAWRYAVQGLRRKPTSPYPYVALTHLVTRVEPQRIADLARLFGRGMG